MVLAQQHRQSAMLLVGELRQETENLTTLVKGYTSTGETRYLTYYYDILAIRQGEKPRPENYVPGVFWEMAIAGEIQPRFSEQGEARSLADRMKLLGFSGSELNALHKVFAATEDMKQVEQIAFASTQGLYDSVTKHFVSDGAINLKYASELVHSQQYNELKSNLVKSVAELMSMVDTRTNLDMTRATNDLKFWISMTFGSMVLTILMVLATSQFINASVLHPITKLSETAERLAEGDYTARTSLVLETASDTVASKWRNFKKQESVEELVTLGLTLDGMATSIEKEIAERKAANEEIKHLAFYDTLTNLPNRRLLMDRLQQASISSERNQTENALVFIDLDKFKALNDTLGHAMGDLLLQQVAQRLKSCVREEDTVARLGGDEFVLLLSGLSSDSLGATVQAKRIGEKILVSLNEVYQLGEHVYQCSASVGIALFGGKAQSIDQLMTQADMAMYQAKQSGRNALRFFEPT